MTPPTFNPAVPENLTDSFATSQPQLQNNFIAIFTAFARNHVSINDVNAGNHNIIELVERANPVLTNLDETAIYTKNVEGQTDEVFIRYQGQGQEFQFTTYQIYKIPPENGFLAYFTFLPGGIIAYFGFFPARSAVEGRAPQILQLNPPIAKNIIGMTTCFAGTATYNPNPISQPLSVIVTPPVDEIYRSLRFTSNLSVGSNDTYYFILANT